MTTLPFPIILLTAAAGVYTGAQNTFAGGGLFITFPVLLLVGPNPPGADMTSMIAPFPGQITSLIAGRKLTGNVDASGRHSLLWQLVIISLVGGVLGALLLLVTPPLFFVRLVPYLVLFATNMFVWGSFHRKPLYVTPGMSTTTLTTTQFATAIHGGYLSSGIGFLMPTVLTVTGQQACMASVTKDMLAMIMNVSAVVVFASPPRTNWAVVVVLGIGGIAGGFADVRLLHRLSEKTPRGFVVIIGTILTVWPFMRA